MRCASASRSAARRGGRIATLSSLLRSVLRRTHVIHRLIQTVQSLLQLLRIRSLRLLTAVLLLACLAAAGQLLRRLLAGLPLAALPALLSLLTLLILILLAVAGKLFHLFPQLFRFAAQHFLLPALFKALLLALILILGQLLLPPGQFGKLLQRFIDFLLPLLRPTAAAATLASLVLILFRVEFQVEHAG